MNTEKVNYQLKNNNLKQKKKTFKINKSIKLINNNKLI